MNAIVCKNCGGRIEADENQDFAVCPFCKTTMSLYSERIQVVHVVDRNDEYINLKILADRSYEKGIWEEAADFYSKMLEIEPNDPLTVFKRTISQLYMNIHSHIDINGFKNNIKMADELAENLSDEKKQEYMSVSEKEKINLFRYAKKRLAADNREIKNAEECKTVAAEWTNFCTIANFLCGIMNDNDNIRELTETATDFLDKNVVEEIVFSKDLGLVGAVSGLLTPNVEGYVIGSNVLEFFGQTWYELAQAHNRLPGVSEKIERPTNEILVKYIREDINGIAAQEILKEKRKLSRKERIVPFLVCSAFVLFIIGLMVITMIYK